MPWLTLTWIGLHRHIIFAGLSWLIALVWLSRVLPALWMLPRIPNLLDAIYDGAGSSMQWPSITVVVPAKNEAAAIEHSLRGLLASDYAHLAIVAVDDRSTDATGDIMDRLALEPEARGRLRVLHVRELPEGWLGKPHAMALAATGIESDWLVFTDADVLFAPDALRRAVTYAMRSKTDHFVIFPTLMFQGWAEKMLIAFFQSVSALAARPWKIGDPRAKRDYIGVGAFNMIRRPVYESLQGFMALRMEVLEDMRLGYRVKQAGHAQRVAFGKDLLRIRWAESAWGILGNLTKNLFAAFRFRTLLLLGACIGMFLLCLGPFFALAISGASRWAGLLALTAMFAMNLRYWKQTRISPIYLALFPVATMLFLLTLMRSMFLVLRRGGVLWRGTLYPLKELRRHAGPLW